MSTILRQILSYDTFIVERPAMSIYNNEQIQQAINTTGDLLDSKTNGLITLVWQYNHPEDSSTEVDTTGVYYRTEFELNQIVKAFVAQTQYVLNLGNDFTIGSSSLSSGGLSGSFQRPTSREEVAPGVYEFLARARVYTLQNTLKNTCSEAQLTFAEMWEQVETIENANKKFVPKWNPNAQPGTILKVNDNNMVDYANPAEIAFNVLNADKILAPNNEYQKIQDIANLAWFGNQGNNAMTRNQVYQAINGFIWWKDNIAYPNEAITRVYLADTNQLMYWKSNQDNNLNHNPITNNPDNYWWSPVEDVDYIDYDKILDMVLTSTDFAEWKQSQVDDLNTFKIQIQTQQGNFETTLTTQQTNYETDINNQWNAYKTDLNAQWNNYKNSINNSMGGYVLKEGRVDQSIYNYLFYYTYETNGAFASYMIKENTAGYIEFWEFNESTMVANRIAVLGKPSGASYNYGIIGTYGNGNIVIQPHGTGQIDATSHRIMNVIWPTNNTDAANKNYVDSSITTSKNELTTLINTNSTNDRAYTDNQIANIVIPNEEEYQLIKLQKTLSISSSGMIYGGSTVYVSTNNFKKFNKIYFIWTIPENTSEILVSNITPTAAGQIGNLNIDFSDNTINSPTSNLFISNLNIAYMGKSSSSSSRVNISEATLNGSLSIDGNTYVLYLYGDIQNIYSIERVIVEINIVNIEGA